MSSTLLPSLRAASDPRAAPEPADPKAVVRRGWNRASFAYRPSERSSDFFGHSSADHEHWLRPFLRTVPRGAEVLDLGCGCGVPDARLLAERFRVTGVDISDVQVRRARRLVPSARFVRADMTEIRFPPRSFGGVVCLYALIHVPLDEQRPLLERVHRWLQTDGLLLVTTGESAYTGTEENWLGSNAKMYWSHADAGTYEGWLTAAGFEVVRRTRVLERPDAAHILFLARKRGRSTGPDATAPGGGATVPPSPR